MIRTICGIAVVFVIMTGGSLRADVVSAPKPLTVYAGSIVFNNPEFDSLPVVDFPFTIRRHEFEFFRPDTSNSEMETRVFAIVHLYGVDGVAVDSSDTYFTLVAADSVDAADSDLTIFNRLSVRARPGVYTARLNVIDVVSKREGDYFMDRVVVEPPSRRLDLGAVTLAYSAVKIADSSQRDRNVLNGYRVLANPINVFSVNDSGMTVYAELYNLKPTDKDNDRFFLDYTVLDHRDSVYRDLGGVLKHKPGASAVIVQPIEIAGYLYGDYKLRITASDPASGEADTALVPFRIFPEPDQLAQLTQVTTSDPYDTLSLDDKLHLVEYLLTPAEKQTLDLLLPQRKSVFLDQYWKEHDSDPETPIIENRLDMISRYEYVQRYFSTDAESADGWQTDRGRIYMKYGPWEDRVDIQAPEVGDPYVVWYYHTLRGGVLFVFEDKGGLHDYRLVHSNMPGEHFDKTWDLRLEQDVFKSD